MDWLSEKTKKFFYNSRGHFKMNQLNIGQTWILRFLFYFKNFEQRTSVIKPETIERFYDSIMTLFIFSMVEKVKLFSIQFCKLINLHKIYVITSIFCHFVLSYTFSLSHTTITGLSHCARCGFSKSWFIYKNVLTNLIRK